MSGIVWATKTSPARHATLLQELIDLSTPRACFTLDAENDHVSVFCPVGCRHWSRVFEWPWAIEEADLRGRDVVLEAGGGDTELQFALACRTTRVVNFDHDQGVLDAAEQYARRLGVANLLCRRGDLTSIYYPDNSFDKIFCISVIEHITNGEHALDELWRVLKPGGRLLLTMDIAERAEPRYLFDLARAARLLEQQPWGLAVPDFPENGLRGRTDDGSNMLSVLCARLDKPV